jgi:hypothetical protein
MDKQKKPAHASKPEGKPAPPPRPVDGESRPKPGGPVKESTR